jgi:hypothetical protein
MDYEIVDRCVINHEMSTKSRGSILPAERGSRIGEPGDIDGLEARNAFALPDDCGTDAGGDPGNYLTEGRA